jgi:O-acetyl-ADP-ribose deacetylase (regulator of RNase III)
MKQVKGNLLAMAEAGDFDVITHGCNCFLTMGAGIAGQISKRYPAAFAADKTTKSGDRTKLGSFTAAEIKRPNGTSFYVVNAYTQYRPGACFEHSALEKALVAIRAEFGGKGLRFGMPFIGAGIGGGDWTKIAPAIEAGLAGEDVAIVKWDGT